MKKFIKIFIVVLLVLAVIGGTCFFFFKKNKEKNETTGSIVEMLNSESKYAFDEMLFEVKSLMKDERLNEVVLTSSNLDNIVYNLSSYYISTNTSVRNKDIKNALSSVESSRSLLVSMLNEYKIKTSSTYFKRQEGANDLFKQSCYYLVSYANLAKTISSSLNVDRDLDVKFNVYDVYLNVVISTFGATETIEKTERVEGTGLDETISFVKVVDLNNVSLLNEEYIIDKLYDNFKIEVNLFNKYYKLCNKMLFANDLSGNVDAVDNENQTTNEKIATYYFKEIFGI